MRPIDRLDDDVLGASAFVSALTLGLILPVIPVWSDALLMLAGGYSTGKLLAAHARRRYIKREVANFRRSLDLDANEPVV